jgi:ABC-type transporter Mla subunit MlaD
VRAERRKRLPNWAVGLILVVITAVLSVYAFTKSLPWADKYSVEAVFANAGNVRPDSPVRIAGVNVGKVTSVEHLTGDDAAQTAQTTGEEGVAATDGLTPASATVVTMELDDSALPLHTDATMKLRPRLFLEGNLFVDLRPGSPNAPEADDGHQFPIGQTAVAVQLDQVLTTLQSDVRTDLQVLLDQFGNALDKHGGSEGLRELFRSSPGAFRYTSQVNEAMLGTEPHDLSDLIVNLDSTVEALGRNEGALQDLVTNLRIVLGSFAAESDALEAGIAELPRVLEEGTPALASLNRAFPAVRAFAREALPGVRSTPAMLDATTPFLRQLRGLVSEDELRGLVADLRPAIPDLARMTRRTIPLLKEVRPLASCVNEVLIPWSQDVVPDPDNETINGDGSVARLYEETDYAVEGLSGFSRSGDANGPYARVLGMSGPNIFSTGGERFASSAVPLLGVLPSLDSSLKAPFRPDVGCETQDPPNLASNPGTLPTEASAAGSQDLQFTPEMEETAAEIAEAFDQAERLSRSGDRNRERKGADLLDESLAALAEALRPAFSGGGEGG